MTVTLLSFVVILLTTCVGLLKAQTLLAAVTKEYHWVKRNQSETRDSTALCNKWGMRVASSRNEKEQSVVNKFLNYDSVCEKIAVDFHGNEWGGTCQTGLKQSPIDLIKGLLRTQPLQWHMMSKAAQRSLEFTRDAYVTNSFIIVNNGHTVKIMFNAAMTSSARMSGYGLEEGYIFAQAHFHWGTSGFPGSEHALNGSRHSMEIHLVHYKSTYANLHAAVAGNDLRALAVYGVFLEGVPFPPSLSGCAGCPFQPEWFKTIIDNIPLNYNNPGGKTVSARLDLRPLLPVNGGNGIFRYQGSLTTPNCNEGVIWTMKREPVQVRQADVDIFRSVRDSNNRPLKANFRPLKKASPDHKLEYFTNS